MSRRNSRKIAAAHHVTMLTNEQARIRKTRRKAARRQRNQQIARTEALLCSAFTDVAVGTDTKNVVRPLGSPVVTHMPAAEGRDVNMKPVVRKKVKVRKDKKAERRRKKIRERQQRRAAMVM